MISNLAAAQQKTPAGNTEIIYCSEFHLTKPLREMAPIDPSELKKEFKDKKEAGDKKYRSPNPNRTNKNALPLEEDPARQKQAGYRSMDPPLVSWDGMDGFAYPPDPTGAAGPEYFVQAVNSSYEVFSKTGSTVPNGGPFSLGSLLFNSNDGDPIVLYDKYADRWVVTEFKFSGKKVLFGISQTSDPTGAYYTYQFTSPQFPDYQKFAIWTDGYYMTSNQNNQKVFVFERDSMLVGVPTSRAINKTFTPPNGGGFFCPLAADADGQLPPAGTPCPIFTYEDDGWGSGYNDRINIFDAAASWGVTPTLTITPVAQLPTEPFDASYDPNWDDVVQPGTNNKLDGIGGVFTFRAQYRRWTGYNTVVLNKGVKVNATTGQRSIRWYELRQDEVTGTWSIYQQSTYAPDDANRWMGSIAMDDNGSIGIAYAISDNVNIYPGIRYTGRLATDSLNQLTFEEETAATGNWAQIQSNRYGDYSHTSIDPVDGTLFWHTGEYLVDGGNATKIFSFRIPQTAISIEDKNAELLFNTYQDNHQLIIEVRNLPASKDLIIDLFDITGRKIQSKTVTPLSYSARASFETVQLPAGTYLVRIGNMNTSFQKVKKVILH
ncbi:MAG: T9SS type A sorting domain-containing protein [Bacteroidales bacterium]